MPDVTTTYLSNTLGRVRVIDMHPCHARNALALILSNPDEARRQFSTPVFSSEVNQNLHARAGGMRYAVVTHFPVPLPPSQVRSTDSRLSDVTIPRYVGRRAEARLIRKAYIAGGLKSNLYRITDAGVFEKVR